MKIRLTYFLALGIILSACTMTNDSDNHDHSNPFIGQWHTRYGTPPFDRIRNSDYLPAFEAALAEQNAEIKKIIVNDEPPTFANTIEAFERTGKLLTRVSNVFFAVNGANTNDTIQAIAKEISPRLSSHNDSIFMNLDLFNRIKAVNDSRDSLNLNTEQNRLLEETFKSFVRSGVNLSDSDQARLREINSKLATLSQKFGENLLAETNDLTVNTTNKEDLGSLPSSLVAVARNEAERRGEEGWTFTLSRPSINPFLQYSPNRELRKKLFNGYGMRGDNNNDHDNKVIAEKMASLRYQRAKLMGYPTHAAFILSDNMAENPKNVYELLDKVWSPALKVAKSERSALEDMMHQDGVQGNLEGWDWRYYVEKVRKARYDLDEDVLRPYFEVNNVRDGVFLLATKLYGITFTRLNDVATWHPDQQVFEVKEANGEHLGILYMDFFARPSKRGGAWMNALRSQSKLDGVVSPIVTVNFNFPPPAEDSPSLLSFTEAETLFHECGHAFHGLLSNVTYASLSGTNVPRDFVEFPSQVMENWMAEPEMLKLYAKDYQTGEVFPDELINKVKAVGTFNQGFATVEYIAASYLDMAWHTLKTSELQDARTLEVSEMTRIGLIPQILPRYRTTYFNHIFGGDPSYSAGYYSYLWSEVLDADAFQAFKETSLFDQETAKKYRYMLSQGGTRPGMELYKEFRGREPEIGPLLKRRGLDDVDQ